MTMWHGYSTIIVILLTVIHNSGAQIEIGDYELGCPKGSYKHGKYCYKISNNTEVTYQEAFNYCKNDGGSLAVIRDSETQTFIHRLRMRKFLHCYWFGLHDLNREGNWIFEDQTKLSAYENWDVGEPNNNGGVQDCASLLMHRDLKWDDEYCYMKFLYICEFPVSKCAKNATIYKDKCYEPSHDFSIYEDARNNCKIRGGQLAMIKTKEIDELIRAIIYNDTFWLTMSEDEVKNVYVGLALKFTWIAGSWIGLEFKDNEWKFIDGTISNFTHWYNDEQSYDEKCAILGKTMSPYACGILYSHGKTDYTHAEIDNCYKYAHTWNKENCYKTHSYICQYSVSLQETSIANKEIEADNKSGASTTTDNLQKPLQYKDDKNDDSQFLHIGVAPFVVMVISCIGFGMLLSVAIYGVIQLKRNGFLINYNNM